MDPNPGIAAPPDPMNEMYDFFAFDEALENGLNVDALIEEQAAQGRPHIEARMNQLMAQLIELIDVNEREREELVGEARGLAPREAKVYCSQLSQRVNELTQTISKQQKEFDLAEKETRSLTEQNAILVPSIVQIREKIKRDKESHAHFQGQLYAAGNALCQYVGNPNQINRNGNDIRKYPSSTKPGSRGF
jgi:hypothetical protein